MLPLVVIYLGAITFANLVIAFVGPIAVLPVGFVLIGLDLVARDRLHDQLGGYGRATLVAGMGAVIVTGGALSYAIALATGSGPLVGRIALASCVAFTIAATLDSITYQLLERWSPRKRSAASNVPAAAADSWLFLALAFPGPVPILLVAAQFAVKVAGGALWAVVAYRREPAAA